MSRSAVLLLIRRWGLRGSLALAGVCTALAVYYLAGFLASPPSLRIFGIYYGFGQSAEVYGWGAVFAVLLGLWFRFLSGRMLLATGMGISAFVLNTAFSWTSGLFDQALVLIQGWFPQQLIAEYLSLVQFPVYREAILDYYYLAWLGLLIALSIAFFRSRAAARLIHTFELASLVLLPLPIEVYLFDRQEFTIRVMDAQVHTPLLWFTNADMLGALLGTLALLAFAEKRLLKGVDEGNGETPPIAGKI